MFFTTLLLLATIGFIATDVYLPSLPFIVKDLATTKALVQLTLASYLASFGLSQLYYGPLSEKVGRRKTVILGFFFMIIGSVLCIISPNIWVLILGRFIEGIGVGSGAAVFRAILRDVFHGDELSQKGSYITVGTALTMSAAPAIGGYIQSYLGWRFNFVFISLYTLVNLIIVWFFLKETIQKINPNAIHRKHLVKNYITLIKSPIFMGYAGCGIGTFGGLTAYLSLSPFLFQNVLKLSSIKYGWLAIFISLGLGLGGLFNNLWIPKIGRHQLLKLGTIIQGTAGLTMLILVLFGLINVSAIMIPMLIYMFGTGLVFANAFAGAFHFFSSIAGYAGALYGSLQILGGTIFAIAISFVHANTQLPLSLALIFVGLINFFFQSLGHTFTLKCENNQK